MTRAQPERSSASTSRAAADGRSPERFLAIAAAAHGIADALPLECYPIGSWEALRALVVDMDFDVRAPEGQRLGTMAISHAIGRIETRVGNRYFPLRDPDDLTHKAGQVLVSLVLSHHRVRTPTVADLPDVKDRIAALRRPHPKESS